MEFQRKSNERYAIINDKNLSGLIRLYGEMNIEELSSIVNKHIAVAIEEIEEDETEDVYDRQSIRNSPNFKVKDR